MELVFEGIDLFSGAGGVTTGIESAEIDGRKIARVLAAINHDDVAIKSHAANHPLTKHFIEDIKSFDVSKLPEIKSGRHTITYIWASLECTNFSNAKGGLPRDADSRTLAEHLFRYIEKVDPDYIIIENVREFMSWGPLDANGKPVSRDKGRDFIRWVNKVKSYGYDFDYKILNSADLGECFTRRKRLFIIFSKEGVTAWPEAEYSRNGEAGLKKHLPVKECLDFSDEGESIFGRKKDLSDKTDLRILNGLIKFIANGDMAFLTDYNFGGENRNMSVDRTFSTITTSNRFALVQPAWLLKYNSASNNTTVNKGASVDEPSPVISTQVRLALIQPRFLVQRNGGNPESRACSIDEPARTVTATGGNLDLVQPQFILNYNHSSDVNNINDASPAVTAADKLAVVSPDFLIKYYSTGQNISGMEEPASTITTKDRMAFVQPDFFIDEQYGQSKGASVDKPAGALLGNPKQNLVAVNRTWVMNTSFDNTGSSINEPCPVITANRKHHYLINPQYKNPGSSVDNPCFTLIARMDKMPPYLVTTESGQIAIEIYEGDSETRKKIKMFMAYYGIVDIKMRMLRVDELLKIQGFPEGYILHGTQAQRKKFIGNAVVPVVAKKIFEALYKANLERRMNEAERAA